MVESSAGEENPELLAKTGADPLQTYSTIYLKATMGSL